MVRGAWAVGVAGALIVSAAVAQLHSGQTLSGFRVPEYDPEGTMRSQLFGDVARVLPNDIVEIEGVRLEMYRDGEVETRATSPHSIYDRRTRTVASTSSVRITRGGAVITGYDYRYDPDKETFLIQSNARVVLRESGRELRGAPVRGPARTATGENP